MRYVVRVTVEGQSWYIHQCGTRADNADSAMRVEMAYAMYLVGVFLRNWHATAIKIKMVND